MIEPAAGFSLLGCLQCDSLAYVSWWLVKKFPIGSGALAVSLLLGFCGLLALEARHVWYAGWCAAMWSARAYFTDVLLLAAANALLALAAQTRLTALGVFPLLGALIFTYYRLILAWKLWLLVSSGQENSPPNQPNEMPAAPDDAAAATEDNALHGPEQPLAPAEPKRDVSERRLLETMCFHPSPFRDHMVFLFFFSVGLVARLLLHGEAMLLGPHCDEHSSVVWMVLVGAVMGCGSTVLALLACRELYVVTDSHIWLVHLMVCQPRVLLTLARALGVCVIGAAAAIRQHLV